MIEALPHLLHKKLTTLISKAIGSPVYSSLEEKEAAQRDLAEPIGTFGILSRPIGTDFPKLEVANGSIATSTLNLRVF